MNPLIETIEHVLKGVQVNCAGKLRFPTEQHAQDYINRVKHRPGSHVRNAYHCPTHRCWHMTSQDLWRASKSKQNAR